VRLPTNTAYIDKVRKMEHFFDGIWLQHSSRAQNFVTDELSKQVTRREKVPPRVFLEVLTRRRSLQSPSRGPGRVCPRASANGAESKVKGTESPPPSSR
jgi:hypothetical protein